MSKEWQPLTLSHYQLGTTTLANCIRVERLDGVILRATAHDRDLEIDGQIYYATASFSPSDVVSGASLAPDNLEIEGFLASPAITQADVRSGAWDYAKVEMFAINFRDTTMGRNYLRAGTLGEVRAGGLKFVAELRGLLQSLSRRIVDLLTRECRHDFGDNGRVIAADAPGCHVDLALWTVTGTVGTAASARQFTDAARTEPADRYTAGRILWLTGANAGRSMEVKQSTSAGVITLHEFMPDPIAPTDTYSLRAGCQKRRAEDCRDTYDNVVNHGGADFLPGQRIYERGGVS